MKKSSPRYDKAPQRIVYNVDIHREGKMWVFVVANLRDPKGEVVENSGKIKLIIDAEKAAKKLIMSATGEVNPEIELKLIPPKS